MANLLAKGSVQLVLDPDSLIVVSPLSVVERRGKYKLVLDLSWVNEFIDKEAIKFKYENITAVSSLFTRDDVLFTIDLESAYHHVDMHRNSWPFLGFEWRGKHYQFTVLPFGLATACWVFTKLSRKLVGHWRTQGVRLLHYLDDMAFGVKKDLDGGHKGFDRVRDMGAVHTREWRADLGPRWLNLAGGP